MCIRDRDKSGIIIRVVKGAGLRLSSIGIVTPRGNITGYYHVVLSRGVITWDVISGSVLGSERGDYSLTPSDNTTRCHSGKLIDWNISPALTRSVP